MPFMKDRLKDRRVALNITLQEVADVVGVKEATAQRYESGVIQKIDTLTVEKLAQAVNCSPAYLMGWVDDPLNSNGIKVGGSISSSQVVNAPNGSMVALGENTISKQALDLVRIFENLDLRRQSKLINLALKLDSEVNNTN